MPMYEYECQKCGERWDERRLVEERDVPTVHQCDLYGPYGQARRVPSLPAGLHFKGPGFHCNDYPKEGR